MKAPELPRTILSHKAQDGLLATGVLRDKLAAVMHYIIDYYPVVLAYLCTVRLP